TAPIGGTATMPLTVCASGCAYDTVGAALAAAADGDTISIAAGTYSGGLTITKNVSILGAGAQATTISGGGPVVFVRTGVTATLGQLTLSGGDFIAGGGIRNEGTLNLKQVTVSGNHSSCCGGGIANLGSMTIKQSSVVGNSADDHAGGIDNDATMTI